MTDTSAMTPDEVRAHVAKLSVDCLNCGGRLFYAVAAQKWRHVRGDRLGPHRCRPGSLVVARPAIDADGQTVLDTEGGR